MEKKTYITLSQIIKVIMKELSNQKKHDKGSIGYIINAIEKDSIKGLYWDSCKRSELLQHLQNLITRHPKCLNSLLSLQPFKYLLEDFNNIICALINSHGGFIMCGSYNDCAKRKFEGLSYFIKKWQIRYFTSITKEVALFYNTFIQSKEYDKSFLIIDKVNSTTMKHFMFVNLIKENTKHITLDEAKAIIELKKGEFIILDNGSVVEICDNHVYSN